MPSAKLIQTQETFELLSCGVLYTLTNTIELNTEGSDITIFSEEHSHEIGIDDNTLPLYDQLVEIFRELSNKGLIEGR